MISHVMFKPEVRCSILHLRPQVIEMLRVGMFTAPAMYDDVLVITSMDDGKHSQEPKSGHYLGCSFDVRTHGFRSGGILVHNWSRAQVSDDPDLFRKVQDAAAKQWAADWGRALATLDCVILAETSKVHIHAQRGLA